MRNPDTFEAAESCPMRDHPIIAIKKMARGFFCLREVWTAIMTKYLSLSVMPQVHGYKNILRRKFYSADLRPGAHRGHSSCSGVSQVLRLCWASRSFRGVLLERTCFRHDT